MSPSSVLVSTWEIPINIFTSAGLSRLWGCTPLSTYTVNDAQILVIVKTRKWLDTLELLVCSPHAVENTRQGFEAEVTEGRSVTYACTRNGARRSHLGVQVTDGEGSTKLKDSCYALRDGFLSGGLTLFVHRTILGALGNMYELY